MGSGARATPAVMNSVGVVVYWIGIALAAFGVLSTVMSIALFEGTERYEGALGWAGFAVASYIVGRVVRALLSR